MLQRHDEFASPSSEQLLELLADWEAGHEPPDHRLSRLKHELDVLADDVRAPPVGNPYEHEQACLEAIERIRSLTALD